MNKNKLLPLITAFLLGMGIQNPAYTKEENSMNDALITTAIKAKMVADKTVSASNITVTTENGIVTLSGDVKSKAEADAAIDIASTTEGVVDIRASDLLVQGSSQPFTDAIITGKIKALYAKEKIFGDKPVSVVAVHVETNDGVVYLKGTVDNKAQAENAKRLAENVKGVRKVDDSNLVVRQS